MSNHWWEITVVCNPIFEETIFWRLSQFGCSGTVTHPGNPCMVQAYIPDLRIGEVDLIALQEELMTDLPAEQQSIESVSWKIIEEEDWASGWKQYWQPQKIGDRFLVYPAWLEPPQNTDRLILRLDPGAAFGTGTHATTQLCLESLEMRLTSGAKDTAIADIGCGSGILSLGAMLLGAKEAIGVDNDPLAVKTCRANCLLNDVNQAAITIEEGSIRDLVSRGQLYDGVLCNILANIIVKLFPDFNAITHEKSWAILSGILIEQADLIADVVENNGWTIATIWKREPWCCFNIRRSQY